MNSVAEKSCCYFFLSSAYRYGNTLVTMSEDDKANMKYKAEKCLKVLGFTKMENVSKLLLCVASVCS